MRKNRKRSMKMSVIASRTLHLGSILLVLFVAVIVNLLANSSCNQMMKVLGDKQKVLTALEKDLDRETALWEEMKSPSKLDRALIRHGMAMALPTPKQYVYLLADGTPRSRQYSVDNVRQRQSAERIAMSTASKKIVRR